MAKMWRTLAGVDGAVVLGAGCLVKDDIATWYLEPSGAVTWSVMEKDVRSDAENIVDRQTEEANYIAAVRAVEPSHGAWLRRARRHRRPHAHPPRHGAVHRRDRGQVPERWPSWGPDLLQRLGLPGTSTLTQAEVGTTWTFSVRDPHAPEASAQPDDDLSALSSGLDALKIVLTEGRFVAAEGFELSGDRRTATMIQARRRRLQGPGGAGLHVDVAMRKPACSATRTSAPSSDRCGTRGAPG